MNERTGLDYSALGWVKSELDATLRQAAEALESCAADSADSADPARLQLCVTTVHQVHGILQMLELYGAAVLAEEMERVAEALLIDSTRGRDVAQEVLMRAILHLKDYLERVEDGHQDAAILLLPLINELRTARNAPVIAESALFAPDLDLRGEQPQWPKDGSDAVAVAARRTRPLYQRGLLAYLRRQNPADGLAQMREALLAMDRAGPDDRSGRLWWLTAGLTDVLDAGELPEHASATRRLLSQVEHQLKAAMETGAGTAAPEDLLRGLLYYLAHAAPVTERVRAIQGFYDLPALVAEQARVEQSRERALGPGRDALSGLVQAVREDLAHVKDTLDLQARGSVRNPEDVVATATSLSRIADTLAVVGLPNACALLQEQAEQVRTLFAGGAMEEHRALQVAEALLYVESSLVNLVDGRQGTRPEDEAADTIEASFAETEYRNVFAHAISEAITELGYLKEAIAQFVESGERQRLAGVERRFEAVRGSLALMELDRAPDLLAATERFLRERVLGSAEPPSPQALEALADAITGIEYYLEALREGRSYGERGLDVSEEGLRRLDSLGPPSVGAAGEQSPDVPEEIANVRAPTAAAEQREAATRAGNEIASRRRRVEPDVPVTGEEIDPEILEIFLEEADELQASLREVFPRWQRDAEDAEALLTTRRIFHTLKGSGRLAGALLLGELAWALENLLNRILDHTLEPTPRVHEAVTDALDLIPELIEGLRGGTSPSGDVRTLIRKALILSEPARHHELEALTCTSAVAERESSAASQQDPVKGQEPFSLVPSETELTAGVQDDPEARRPATMGKAKAAEKAHGSRMDALLYEIFSKETGDHLACIETFLAECEHAENGRCRVAERLIRSLHTLAGSARMALVEPIALVGRELEELAASRCAEGRLLDAHDQDVLKRGAQVIRAVVEALGRDDTELPDVSELVRDIEFRRAALPDAIIESADRAITRRSSAPPLPATESPEVWLAESDEAPPEFLRQPIPSPTAHTRAEAAPAASPPSGSANLTAEDEDLVQVFLEEADDILGFLEGIVERWEAAPDDETQVAELHRPLHTLKGGARLAGFEGIGHLCHALESLVDDVGAQRVPADDRFFDLLHASLDRLSDLVERVRGGECSSTSPALIARIEELRGARAPASAPQGDPNRELVEVFLQESADILTNTEALLYDWRQHPSGFTRVPELQRALHTLKGGARMAGFKAIADLSHGVETLLNAFEEGEVEFDEALLDVLESANDHLMSLRETAASNAPLPDVEEALEGLARLHPGECGLAAAAVEPEEPRAPAAAIAEAEPEAEPEGPQSPHRQPDQVRVQSQLLDNLVNLAGEVSIYRSRLEQQGGDIVFNLTELGQTVSRLREQLRALEIETEAQIIYRFEREHGSMEREGFDPLELDRFSRIQELSRALSESVNDLTNIQDVLNDLNRESETLLLQQSRVNTELQDGLMRTRMVPFANLVPRMRRVVRQACEELGKRAQLKVLGAQGEMDRTVLERLIPPLEHMLRNAVAHGIELPSARAELGKAEVGTICMAWEREGGDVTIRVHDDGAGMNLKAIRAKAISRGLMSEDSLLSDKEIMQFVLEPGFSTAEQVTQIAGRGVGLDVVNAEIKQLGRSLEIDSEQGVGTHFVARLPFTLALNQALLCQTGDEVYAIPLSSIEGVVRLGQDELRDIHASEDGGFYSYAGERYEVRSLAGMLGSGDGQPLTERPRVPLILVQAGEHRLAMQVDGLLGRREIVVKSAGPQISSVPGMLGATILADGRVVFILDIGALIRYESGSSEEGELEERPALAVRSRRKRPRVMVVDDSITMRKVATRLLQRNEIDVMTAKDGVDAVAALQDLVPDAMLLDIEMPRMDGYELATHVRNDDRLRSVPIIVITSRTGEKHRQKAMEIGVDRYLGKPYQESELLAAVQDLLTVNEPRS